MKFSEERARLESLMNTGRLSWRQYHAGQAFVSEAARQIVALADDPDHRRRLTAAGLRQAATWPDEDDVADDLARTYTAIARDRRYKGFWNESGGFTVR